MPNLRQHSASHKSDALLQENVGMLFEELELAVKWDRPSLLLAVYRSEQVKAGAQKRLKARLTRLHQRTLRLNVDEQNYDVPLALIKTGLAGQVFFVSDLIFGGGKNSANAYRALNIRRELLIENKARVIFWLTDYEFILLPYFAPDFWAFRHRVIDFTNVPVPVAPSRSALDWESREFRAAAEKKIPILEMVLANLPANAATGSTRTGLLITLAGLRWLGQDFSQAGKHLQAAISISDSLALREERHRALAGLGHVHAASGLPAEAARCYRQALKVFVADPALWHALADSYLQMGWKKRALTAAQKSLALRPASAAGWLTLGRIHARAGDGVAALKAFRRALQIGGDDREAWAALAEALIRVGPAHASSGGNKHATRKVK